MYLLIILTLVAAVASDAGTILDERINDCAKALNYLYETIPDHEPFEEKCKKYAIMSSFLSSKGRPHTKAMSRFCSLSAEDMNQIYRKLGEDDRLPELYMAAIDGYRSASQIGPPFLELIECLERFNRPYVETYLNSSELVQVVDLYKSIVRSPEVKIDFGPIEKKDFSPAFLTSLRHLFRDNLFNFQDDDSENHSGDQLRKLYPWSTHNPHQMISSHRHRERERLRNYRKRLLNKPLNRDKTLEERRRLRRRERQRKEREKQKRESLKRAEEWYSSYLARFGVPVDQMKSVSSQKSGQQEQEARQHPDQDNAEPLSPDLSQLWAEAAPIYYSIETPTATQQHPLSSLLDDHDGPSYPFASPQQQLDQTPPEILSPSQSIRPEYNIPTSLMAENMPTWQIPSEPQKPFVEPMTEFSHFHQPVYRQESHTPDVSCDLSSENQCQTFETLTDSDTRSQLDMLPTLDRFDDIDLILQSILY